MNSPTKQATLFRCDPVEYARYLDTTAGRLRTDLALANLREFLPLGKPANSLQVLDIGGGTGAQTITLARLGMHVTLLDSSEEMLQFARRATEESGIVAQIEARRGDAEDLEELLSGEQFDVVLCHNVLEYVGHPENVLRAVWRIMRDSSAILSVVVRNRAGEVFKSAIRDEDLKLALENLHCESVEESLFGNRARLFAVDEARELLKSASLQVIAERGVRVLSDYMPVDKSDSGKYERLYELERELGRRPEFAAVARYTQYLARGAGRAMEDPA